MVCDCVSEANDSHAYHQIVRFEKLQMTAIDGVHICTLVRPCRGLTVLVGPPSFRSSLVRVITVNKHNCRSL